ncbi:polysaccharide pyruvyl transferase family protein [Lacrimispora sp.]|uniref:polysaccharide pyruvyl transferase family protein n=1 Tax=Lacrimispora sp. TaxID=2719234 RepID=UPI0028A090C8|nr:polysaccharide pyruvyl transferase family protein [Lacrimispora sp.]
MKIGLITCHNIKNYGSVYQTYATQSLLQSLGNEVQVIDYRRPGTDHKEFRKLILNESHMAKKKIVGKIVPFILLPSFLRMERVFEEFLSRYINRSETIYYIENELKSKLPKVDVFVAGSDQIWNNDINLRIEYPYYLSFVPKGIPKISISSSFGKKKLNEKEKVIVKDLLKDFMAISTREESGKYILDDLGIKNSYASMDPTLIVDKAIWKKMQQPIKVPQKYILVYQLHRNKEFDAYIKKLSEYYNMPCICITLYYHYALKGERVIVTPKPEQLLYLVNNANYIISDSFHMSVFSILFHKKFAAIYSENSFNGRIQNLLEMTGLQNRIVSKNTAYEILNVEIDYEYVDRILYAKQIEALEWIKDTLQKCNNSYVK